MLDTGMQRLINAARSVAIRLVLVTFALIVLVRGDRREFFVLINIATLRGNPFISGITSVLTKPQGSYLLRSLERLTRMDLLPGSSPARIRASVLGNPNGANQTIDLQVSKVLSQALVRSKRIVPTEFHPIPGKKRFIGIGWPGNPYHSMMYSRLPDYGFSVHLVTNFSEMISAIATSQARGETPHVHLDKWLTRRDAALLVSTLSNEATLSMTAHNLIEIDVAIGSDREGIRIFLDRVDAIHVLASDSFRRLKINDAAALGRVFHVPHPAYYGPFGGSYGLPISRNAARAALSRSEKEYAVGIVGRITERKNLNLLLDAAAILQAGNSRDQSPHIYISGSLYTKYAERILRRVATLSNVTLLPEDLDDETAGLHLSALDIAVVPYQRYLNSGWTLLALSAGIPVIASHSSTASEVVPKDALVEYADGDAQSLADAIVNSESIDAFAARAAALAAAQAVHPDLIANRFAQELAARFLP
ncbi:MAG: glycosyltransferase [Candidatus Limnocylindrus sp.]